jgi:hypothetical protein
MFEVGYIFESTCIFTGGSHEYKVVSRTDTELKCESFYCEMDGIHKVTEAFEIHKDEDGREYIVLWEYKGEQGRHYESVEESEDFPYEDEFDPCYGCQARGGYNCKHCQYGDDGNYSVYDVYTPAELGIKTSWR